MSGNELPAPVAAYLRALPALRRDRLLAIIHRARASFPDTICNMKYNMPTVERAGNWLSVANQQQYISVYTHSIAHIQNFLDRHSETKHGKGCLNFGDYDDFPLKDLDLVINEALETPHV